MIDHVNLEPSTHTLAAIGSPAPNNRARDDLLLSPCCHYI